MSVVKVSYFSDCLAHLGLYRQARIDAVKETFGDTVELDHRFCMVFGNTAAKIPASWKDKGEYAGFNAHLRHVALQFPTSELHPEVWLKTRPPIEQRAPVHGGGPAMAAGARSGGVPAVVAVGIPLRVFPGLPRHCALGCSMRTGGGAGRRYRRDRTTHPLWHGPCEAGVRLSGRRQDAHRGQPELRPERGAAEALRQCRLPHHRSQHSGIVARAGRRIRPAGVLSDGQAAPYATSSSWRGRARRSGTYSTTM